MFGYVKTDYPNMFVKDTVLYKAAYCGLCKGINNCCGLNGRLLLSYDTTFLSVFLHCISGVDFDVKKEHCMLHPVRKIPVAKPDKLTEKIGALNVILAYYKLTDDVIDNNKGRVKRSFFNSAYKKAKKTEPTLDKIVSDGYNLLLKLEKANSDSIDIVSDTFATLTTNVVKELIKEDFTEDVYSVSYNLGKWIYLIDALDDFDKDIKEKNFNVFVNANKGFDKKTFCIEKREYLENIFGAIFFDIGTHAKNIKYKFNHDLIDNVLYMGLRKQTINVMEGVKCKNIIKY